MNIRDKIENIREGRILSEANYPEIPGDFVKKAYLEFQKVTGWSTPKKTKFNPPFEVKTEQFRFSASPIGILTVDSWAGPIPGFDRYIDFLKKNFSDVYEKGRIYLNVRGYGTPFSAKAVTISEPKSKTPIPEIKVPDKINREATVKLLSQARALSSPREVSWKGNLPVQLISRFGQAKLIKVGNQMYLLEVFTLYWVKDEKDAKNLYRAVDLEHRILRALEVADWENQDFSKPYG